MLDENVNKLVFVSVAVAVVASLAGGSMVMFPNAMNKARDVITESTTSFTKPSDENKLSLEVQIPNYQSSRGSFYEYSSLYYDYGKNDGTWKTWDDSFNFLKNPIFEPNEYDESSSDMGGTDEWSRTFNYTNGLQAWVDNLKNSKSLQDNNGGSVPAKAIVSPFKATDSKGNDITKNIRFKSLKITKLDTVDNKTVSTDTPDIKVTHIPYDSHTEDGEVKTVKGIQFNHEYTDYGELLDAIYMYAGNHGNKIDGNDEKYYVQKAYFTVTYTVTDSDGNSTTQSSSFTVTDVSSQDL